jgi:hypothetical protein
LYHFWLVKPSGKPSSPAVGQSEDIDQIVLERVDGGDDDDDDDEDEEDEEEDPWAGIEWDGDYTFVLEEYERAWTM